MIFNKAINIFLEYLYPENISCILCDKPIKKTNTYSLCKDCFKELNFIQSGCVKCGKPIVYYSLEENDELRCSVCKSKNYYFDKGISCIEYNDSSKNLILAFKYNKKTYLARYIAQIIKEKISTESINFDYILFVPIHKKRLKERGFNQSEKIAKYLSELIDVPVLDCIYRKENTRKLYNLSKIERSIELKNAFDVKNNIECLKNKNVLLVDDIFTTGNTVNEISKLLKINNINKVFVFTLLSKI